MTQLTITLHYFHLNTNLESCSAFSLPYGGSLKVLVDDYAALNRAKLNTTSRSSSSSAGKQAAAVEWKWEILNEKRVQLKFELENFISISTNERLIFFLLGNEMKRNERERKNVLMLQSESVIKSVGALF